MIDWNLPHFSPIHQQNTVAVAYISISSDKRKKRNSKKTIWNMWADFQIECYYLFVQCTFSGCQNHSKHINFMRTMWKYDVWLHLLFENNERKKKQGKKVGCQDHQIARITALKVYINSNDSAVFFLSFSSFVLCIQFPTTASIKTSQYQPSIESHQEKLQFLFF